MNFTHKIDDLEKRITSLKEEATDIRTDLIEAGKFTDLFLNKCAELNISRVAIGIADQETDGAKGWHGGYGMVFSNEARDLNGWPSIWKAVEVMGISGGAGNSNQHQITNEGIVKLVDGVYELKDGKWAMIK